MSENKKKSGAGNPFAEMEKISKYRAEKLAEEQLSETETLEEEVLEEISLEDSLLFPLPEKTVDKNWSLKMLGIFASGAMLAVLIIFTILLTWPLGLGVTDAEFIERYNSLEAEEDDVGYMMIWIAEELPQSIISGTDVIGTDENPTETTTPGFLVSAERRGGKITSVTMELKDVPDYDYENGIFTDNSLYIEFYMHFWRTMSGIDPYYEDYVNVESLFDAIYQNYDIGSRVAVQQDKLFVFSFTDRLYIKVYPRRATIAQFSMFVPPEIKRSNTFSPKEVSEPNVSSMDTSEFDVGVSSADNITDNDTDPTIETVSPFDVPDPAAVEIIPTAATMAQ